MIVRIDQIPPLGRTYEVVVDEERLDRELGREEDHRTHWTGKATSSVTLEPGRGTLDIHGVVHFRHRQHCARCLATVEADEGRPYRLTKILKAAPEADAALVELTNESIDEDYFPGEEIDLTEVLLEVIALETPPRVLCSETCQGLCPVCGINRNQETCRCNEAALDPRFAVLAQLRDAAHNTEREDES